ncbi:uncharacterized protein [Amphiura filiformis]|uniref:uncharacterized protein n=1 Tax=Amphiura filiformis TaxID=82378 RepID=UPI003B20B902
MTDEQNCDTPTKCGGHLTALSGYIISPNYPSSYPNNTKCTWIIQGPTNTNIELRFLNFSLQAPSLRNTCYDWLVIFEEKLDRQEAINHEIACGNLYNESFLYISTGNYVWLQFISNPRTTETGFNITYQIITPDGKHTVNDNGVIIGVSAGSVFLLAFICIIAITFCMKHRSRRNSPEVNQPIGLAFDGPYDVTVGEGHSTFAETVETDPANNYNNEVVQPDTKRPDDTRIYHVLENTDSHAYAYAINRVHPQPNQDGHSSQKLYHEYSVIENTTDVENNRENNEDKYEQLNIIM